jgi:hypothetical protein
VSGDLLLFITLGGLALSIWAIVDAASRPSGAFVAAGSSKSLWIILVVLGTFFTSVIGTVLAIIYLARIRPRVRAISG